ncbi:probable transposase [Lentisphaera araneosa HTCC2155]|jgi:putative transposase|uniref:Probable transposase n=1 Tax=Lentisphaera araneosa HTCC2155 TaxID=313628 RepID=A6DIE5_9BACT|nr:IS200/IS605 family transposase [Lentisphaera araneosa]EDM28799.1 probable transposase [Lentisphaera araneosa HTCC2155]
MSYVQSYYHIVFSVKERLPLLKQDIREDIYKYIWGICKNKGCYLYRIGGIEDHIHMLINLHTSLCLADFIRDLKTSTTTWIKSENIISKFPGWQSEYAAISKSFNELPVTIEYIKNQEDHHKKMTWKEELITLFDSAGVDYKKEFLK